MCEHCKSVGSNGRRIQDHEQTRVLCDSGERDNGNARKASALGCCEWRRTCCGGGCCEASNCCGTGSSGINVGCNNTSYNHRNEIEPMKTGMEINYEMRRGTGVKNNVETEPCESQKSKHRTRGE